MTSTYAQLIVVDDLGGTSALPYYETLGITAEKPDPERQLQPPQIAAMDDSFVLPVRSPQLTPGYVSPRTIQAPGLLPFFLIGDDDLSRSWLKERIDVLQKLDAVGLVVNVDSVLALQNLRDLANGLTLSPVSGDDLAHRLQLKHYPVLITSTGIEQ